MATSNLIPPLETTTVKNPSDSRSNSRGDSRGDSGAKAGVTAAAAEQQRSDIRLITEQ